MRRIVLSVFGILAVSVFIPLAARSAEPALLDPKALAFKLPAQISWGPVSAEGVQSALLYGNPDKPGPYLLLIKWLPHHMSKPHFHPNDRFITVISGTWWVGTGDKWDPEKATPIPPGSFVQHFAKQVHWDGAKDEEAIIEIFGMGPATATPSPTAQIK